MSAALARYATRSLFRSAARARGYATVEVQPTQEWIAKREAVRHHAEETTQLWRRVSYFICAPGIIVTAIWVRNVEAEHEAHEEHLKEEHGGELPEPPAYDYMNKRVKPFPWGNNTLFFNPKKNKDMNQAAEE
ncbi:mitochondrial cytochrome c oxidase subunit VIa [Gloeophyllum trabeum ATCC 11539]|uniref:Mitochondrial cytochrome c oxidase subunit VIa n=1 Tax=Gloeophyllum trabeum (strain ATCC 11539 / FP-39264 / Madison 617) TaxID=670483 RepID=S7QM12_GLOTA|nr:mitochondrial cytochrome c oxidase subunit VIa [Gloeophyllum trabeum ATCC 11539]EPQ60601.1 mitochondrial cytochrome c oxidase subunit VIa [Gloeophyllum trabeum ATCC 11539]